MFPFDTPENIRFSDVFRGIKKFSKQAAYRESPVKDRSLS